MGTERHAGNRWRACLPGWLAVVVVVLGTVTADATGWIDFVRTRHAPELESQRAGFAVSLLNSEIGGAVLTAAELVGPGGRRYPMVRSSSSRSQAFGIDLELASETWPSGTWMLEFREGDKVWDRYPLSLPAVGASSFVSYPPVPEANHEGNPNAVFVPSFAGTTSVITRPYTPGSYVSGGSVYVFPDGGPFALNRSAVRTLAPVSAAGLLGNAPLQSFITNANSEIAFVFHTTPGAPFALVIVENPGGPYLRLLASGLDPGSSYALGEGPQLTTWPQQVEFIPWGNALDLPVVPGSPKHFFRMGSVAP